MEIMWMQDEEIEFFKAINAELRIDLEMKNALNINKVFIYKIANDAILEKTY